MKYKNKYLNLLNQKGGTVPPKPKTLPRCYTFYKNLIDKLSTKNEIDILDFYRYCDNSIILNEKITEQIDHKDICYRVSSNLNKPMYKYIYNPIWFDELIKNVAKEKVV